MSKAVVVLVTYKKWVISLVKQWEDHPNLHGILVVVELLLAIALNTSLVKENIAKFPIVIRLLL